MGGLPPHVVKVIVFVVCLSASEVPTVSMMRDEKNRPGLLENVGADSHAKIVRKKLHRSNAGVKGTRRRMHV